MDASQKFVEIDPGRGESEAGMAMLVSPMEWDRPYPCCRQTRKPYGFHAGGGTSLTVNSITSRPATTRAYPGRYSTFAATKRCGIAVSTSGIFMLQEEPLVNGSVVVGVCKYGNALLLQHFDNDSRAE